MKKIIFILSVLPLLAQAQKEVKPSITKAEAAWQKGKIDEAKAIIDATVSNQEFMVNVDKKGNSTPSKNAAKAWYLKGIIYVSIDTTKNEKFKSLDANPFAAAKEAFEKSKELEIDKQKANDYSFVSVVQQPVSLGIVMPLSKDQVAQTLAGKYLEIGYKLFQAKSYKEAYVEDQKVIFFIPNDTAQLMNAGTFFAPQAGDNDKAVEYINKYYELGGKNTDPYLQLYNIFYQKPDYDNALKIAQKLTAAHPDNSEYLNLEYNVYAKTNRLPEAKALMEKRATADPNDKESRYFVGLICNELKDPDGTMKWMKEAVKVDPNYFDALLVIAKLTYGEGQKLRNERNDIKGSKDADLKKRQELFKQIPLKFKEAQPYWEKCLELKPEEEAYFGLYSLYSDIAGFDPTYEAKITELKRKAKAAGIELD